MAVNGPEQVMLERVIHWRLGGKAQSPFLCTPEALEDMVTGYLLTMGIIGSEHDILTLRAQQDSVSVTLRQAAKAPRAIDERLAGLKPLSSPLSLPLSRLREALARLTGEESYFGTHRLMLLGPGGDLVREDIGRHNAADKVIGAALRQAWDLSLCALGATGRISLEILCKAAVMGIPIVFSKKYASDLSSEWAQRLGIAIVGQAQAAKPLISGAAWRVGEG